jgi:hypothetical protein
MTNFSKVEFFNCQFCKIIVWRWVCTLEVIGSCSRSNSSFTSQQTHPFLRILRTSRGGGGERKERRRRRARSQQKVGGAKDASAAQQPWALHTTRCKIHAGLSSLHRRGGGGKGRARTQGHFAHSLLLLNTGIGRGQIMENQLAINKQSARAEEQKDA